VPAPGLRALGAALVVAVQQARDDGGKQFTVGICRDGVHGAGTVVVADQHGVQGVGGGVFGY